MQSKLTINFNDLLSSFEWVSAAGPDEKKAFICRENGKIYWDDDASDEELPDTERAEDEGED